MDYGQPDCIDFSPLYHGQVLQSESTPTLIVSYQPPPPSVNPHLKRRLHQRKKERKKERKKDFIFHMRILNDIYTWKKYPAYARVEDPL